jgi:hypothetical protein
MSRYSALLIEPKLLRPIDAAAYIGGEGMLSRFVRSGWLKPIVQRKKLTLYKRADLDLCCNRLDTGDFPEG